jgi:chlorobactene glucosyltransferase
MPARNEEQNVAASVQAILAQDYPRFEVIVVDDQSTDGTARILEELGAESSRLRIVKGGPLPNGWAGKPHAIHQALEVARGNWICLIDADTVLTHSALRRCHAAAQRLRADLFTMMTEQIALTFWERTVLPLVLTALAFGFPPARVNDPRRRDAIANGQFILIRREVLDALGGYASIKSEIAEDKAIAERVKGHGFRLVLADGRAVARTRMYASFAALWEGWTKNIYVGLRNRLPLLVLGVLGVGLLLLASLGLPLWTVAALAWSASGGGPAALAVLGESLVLWAAILFARARAAVTMGIPEVYALTTPLGAAVFAAMMLASAWKVISGSGVLWRGRRYLGRQAA